MNKEIKDFAERVKKRMIGWSTHIDDPHAEVYARAFSNIIDECVDEDEYRKREEKMFEIADKLSSMGYRILRVDGHGIDVLSENSDPLRMNTGLNELSYDEAIKFAEGMTS